MTEDTHGSNDAGVVRLLQVKNPWAKKRWKGNYSAQDKINWTPQLKQALNYDPDAASQYDNGVFWIDFKSVRKYFRVVHMNWNPGLFGSNRTVCHYLWPKSQGPPSDSYNYGENPQFSLFVDLESASGAGGTVSDRGRASKESKVVKRSSASPHRSKTQTMPEPAVSKANLATETKWFATLVTQAAARPNARRTVCSPRSHARSSR